MPRDDHPEQAQRESGGATRRGPRARGEVRAALVQAGVELARDGGPDAVVLREVTRAVGVVPNAAYRHFADRDALLAAVRDEALARLSQQMAEGMSRVRAGSHTPTGALLRLRAVGSAYLDFAGDEPGLFDTAFALLEHPLAGGPDQVLPFDRLTAALDGLVAAGVLEASRRPDIQYPTWAAVHGLSMLLRGPLAPLPEGEKTRLKEQVLAFISSAVTRR